MTSLLIPPPTEIEKALAACPGPRSGDPWWARRRHLVMMDFGTRFHPDGTSIWPEAAEYARHQVEFDSLMASFDPA